VQVRYESSHAGTMWRHARLMNPATHLSACPCGSNLPYAGCCGRWHAGAEHLQG